MTISNIEAHNQYIEKASDLLSSLAVMLSDAAEFETAFASKGTIRVVEGEVVTTPGSEPVDQDEEVEVTCFTLRTLTQYAKALGEISFYISTMQAAEAPELAA